MMLSGLPIFPCAANKSPLTPNGFYNAAIGVDPSSWPLVGLRTGATSDLDVLDVDPDGLAWLAANEHRLPTTRRHRTQRGVHLLFKHADGLRNSNHRIAPGVDVRAEGGFAIWWPRQGYSVANDDALAEWPGWLLVLARRVSTPPSDPHRSLPALGLFVPEPTRRFRPRVKAIQTMLEAAPKGRRNHELFKAACLFAEIVAEGLMKPSVATALLESACHTNGLWRDPGDGPERCRATIASAFGTVERKLLLIQAGAEADRGSDDGSGSAVHDG
jgi:hypothetical protein